MLVQFIGQQCSVLFPKQPSKAEKEVVNELLAECQQLQTQPPSAERDAKLDTIKNACHAMEQKSRTKGLRIDLSISDPETQKEMYVDTTCIHPTCQSRLPAEHKQLTNWLASNQQEPTPAPTSQAVLDQTAHKHSVHAKLVTIAAKQAADGKRPHPPKFFAATVSTYGEFGPDLLALQERLTAAYGRRLLREGPRDGGTQRQALTATFRNKFRFRVLIAVARGVAKMCNEVGLDKKSCKKYV